jgi:hypothetical protein
MYNEVALNYFTLSLLKYISALFAYLKTVGFFWWQIFLKGNE